MVPRKLSLFVAPLTWNGNSGVPSSADAVNDWLSDHRLKWAADERIERPIHRERLADTPADMVRNRAVVHAREAGADMLLMIDSDCQPDMYLYEPFTKPFWDSAFDFLYNHYDHGPVVIGAPYCGGSPEEIVYVHHWESIESDTPNPCYALTRYGRDESTRMRGIQPCGCLPTGLILYDMRCFDLIEPKRPGDKPWFYYEYADIFCSQKISTEDNTNTRDIGLAGQTKLGYNPVFCNWDSWAGHHKNKCIGRPVAISAAVVQQKLVDTIRGEYTRDNNHKPKAAAVSA